MLMSPVQGETIGETAYRRIRLDIVFGRLSPGEKLRLDRVSEAYGVSISTLRELLNRLCSEGLAVAEGQRGFEVAPVSAVDFREVAAMRQLLECHALEQSFQRGDLDWEGRVVATHHKLSVMEKRMIGGDRSAPEIWKQCDWQFHHALISACGSKVLLDTHAAIYDRYLRYQMVAVIFRGEIAADQHQKLLECALARDFATGQTVLVDHIQGCVEHALARDTDWATASPAKRVTAPAIVSGKAQDHKVSRRAGRPTRKRTSSA
jgi:DNA-binding GntR family transcriptional regulator